MKKMNISAVTMKLNFKENKNEMCIMCESLDLQ